MTLRDFFHWIGEHPTHIVLFFVGIPLTALLAGIMGRGEGHLAPWKYLYSVLVYGVCIPGIFSVTLSIYLFLFERGSILNANVYTQILPVLSMFLTLGIISRDVPFEAIPGFGKISSLMLMIGSIIVVMWLLDRTHIIAFSFIPIHVLLLIIVGLLLVFRYGMSNLFKK